MIENEKKSVLIIGGGLAGCECALILARYGISVVLYEQKPHNYSPAHISENLGELVCSNSFRSDRAEGPQSSGVGLLKKEMRTLGSVLMDVAEKYKVPAGKALAVDRELFAEELTNIIEKNPYITLERKQVKNLLEVESLRQQHNAHYVVMASGPLTSEELGASLFEIVGSEYCYFYDAIAPIVSADSLDMKIIFKGSRYDNFPPAPYNDEIANSEELSALWREKYAQEAREAKEKLQQESPQDGVAVAQNDEQKAEESQDEGDYLNCPMHKFEYEAFYQALLNSEKVEAHNFEKEVHFEGCMPIEALADRGERTLTFGPLKPVGFTDPRTGRRPYAILQLRAENANALAFNLVGCQTKMTYGAQDTVFRMIPGLKHVEFLRYGSMHRNTYVNAPKCLNDNLSVRGHEHLFLAGQITGVEGYVESIACGLWVALRLATDIMGKEIENPPLSSALGALLAHLKNDKVKSFQPSNIHFGLMPELEEKTKKKNRKQMMAERAHKDFSLWFSEFWGSHEFLL